MRVPTQNKRLAFLAAALLIAEPVHAQTYEAVLVTPQINGAPMTMTPLNLGDDNTRRVSLGFEFDYWGQTFTDAWVSSNGFVSFESAAHLCCDGRPMEQAQRNTIYAYWSDLISFSGNPYYRRGDGSILFGWYGVQEYGTNNSSTFEIGLFADGDIQLNYGSLGSTGGHTFAAGITGPGASDNIELFYGRDTRYFQNQSGILSWVTPAAVVDCDVTPMDPSCPPTNIDIIPDPVESVAEAVEQSVDLAPEEVEQVRETAVLALERAQEVVEESTLAEETEAVAEIATRDDETLERLEPNQVTALSASITDVGDSAQSQETTAQDMQDGSSGTFTTQVRFDTTFGGVFGQGSTVSVAQSASPLDAAISAGNPLSMANTAEVLGLGSPSTTASAGNAPQTDSGISEGESETISAMGVVPGFAAYTQASLRDRVDFYAIRDIYRRRALRDANFEMYRLMQTNDAKWREMVDEQYR